MIHRTSPCQSARRRGSVLPLVVISLVALVGFVALAIDVGLIAVAKTQAQNAADTAAMSAADTPVRPSPTITLCGLAAACISAASAWPARPGPA